MYDPIVQMFWDAGRQWFGLSRGRMMSDPERVSQFKELVRGFKGINQLIDGKVDKFIQELGE